MGTLTTTSLMTVAEFEKLPDPPGTRLELRHGEPVPVTFPKSDHVELQDHIRDLLSRLFPDSAVKTEMPFRPSAEHELWAADVGVVSREIWRAAIRQRTWISGSPEIVVEIVSSSNTVNEMDDREATVLAGGAKEFWLVSPVRRQIRVTTSTEVRRYSAGEHIPAGTGNIGVDEIFSVLT